jgi:hypothetical protein
MAAQVLELFPTINLPGPPKKPAKKDKYSAEFEAFWIAYPRKLNCSKLMTWRSWQKLDAEEQERALAVLPVHCQMMQKRDEEKIPHAATWLNQKRFETIPLPAVRTGPPQIDWAKALRIYAATGRWNAEFGPEPTQPGYRGPSLK